MLRAEVPVELSLLGRVSWQMSAGKVRTQEDFTISLNFILVYKEHMLNNLYVKWNMRLLKCLHFAPSTTFDLPAVLQDTGRRISNDCVPLSATVKTKPMLHTINCLAESRLLIFTNVQEQQRDQFTFPAAHSIPCGCITFTSVMLVTFLVCPSSEACSLACAVFLRHICFYNNTWPSQLWPPGCGILSPERSAWPQCWISFKRVWRLKLCRGCFL